MTSQSPIFEYRDYLKQHYGDILYRVPLDAGFGCPHRGSNGSGGCAFCPEDGARAVQIGNIQDIRQQIHAGVAFAKKRYKAKAFMAYLQAFTSTFTSPELLNELVSTIRKEQHFRAITFGTRPDCLSPEVITYLQSLHEQLDVWVELGIQTVHDKSLKRIHRGHDWASGKEAIYRLHQAGIFVGVHLIIGLPGESLHDFQQTMQTLAPLPIDAVKLHNLHIIKDTALAKTFHSAPFPVFNEYEYSEILLKLLPLIPADLPLIRLTTDSPKEVLIAPHWSMSKGQFRHYLLQQLHKRQVHQGMALQSPTQKNKHYQPMETTPEAFLTEDGSITFWNTELKEYYHTLAGARSEAGEKYCSPAELDRRLDNGPVHILDICFGLGYNSLTACEQAMRSGGHVEITALEIDKRVVETAAEKLCETDTAFNWNNCLQTLCKEGVWSEAGCSIRLLWGDARHTLTQVEGPFDLMWLDAFSTQRNSELWTVDFLGRLLPLLDPSGALLTYCAAIPVRAGLVAAGFLVGETNAFGRPRGGTIAGRSQEIISQPLPERDLFLMETLRGIPYRDPQQTRANKEILRHRELEIVQSKKDMNQQRP